MSQPAHYPGHSLGAHAGGASAGSLRSVSAAPSLNVVMLHNAPNLSKPARLTLWVDAVAGALAGIVLLTWRDSIASVFGFPVELVWFNAAANLAYASYSGTLATLTALDIAPPRRALTMLVTANASWVAVCMGILSQVWSRGTAVGLGYVALEALFVGALAVVEYRVLFGASRS